MARNPAARASAARDNIEYVDVYRPGTLAQIRAGIPEESLDKIDNTPGISWLEFEHDHWLMDGVMSALGREEAVNCWRQSIVQLVEKPLLKSFMDGALHLMSDRPDRFVRMIPKGWGLAYRDFCHPRFVAHDAKHVEMRFEDIHPLVFDSPGYMHCWHGICLGIFDLIDPPGARVDFAIRRDRAFAVAHFQWA